jgi:hypothetical protein
MSIRDHWGWGSVLRGFDRALGGSGRPLSLSVESVLDHRDICPGCGRRGLRRWWADADGDGDVERRAQCDHCPWGY